MMATNMFATFRAHPGSPVLVAIGVSHKPWLDKNLRPNAGRKSD